MPDEMRSGGVPSNNHDDLRYQQLELKNVLQLNIYMGMEYASVIKGAAVFGNSVQPRTLKGFYQVFWHIFHYVKGSVDAEKLNPGLIKLIDTWFELMTGQYRNTKLIMKGVDYFLEFVANMQSWGIGQLFEKGIEPAFMLEDVEDFDILTEKPIKDVVLIDGY
jgi:hypothetical protein